jgi:ribosomal-protein-alanine N-acetyltransferase
MSIRGGETRESTQEIDSAGFQSIQLSTVNEGWLPRLVEIDATWNPASWSIQLFERELYNPAARVRGVFCDGALVGYLIAHVVMDEAHIVSLGVHPGWRGRGFGNLLIKDFLRIALFENISTITLEVRASNSIAQSLYQKVGFSVAGIRRHYYSDNSEDALTMRWSSC